MKANQVVFAETIEQIAAQDKDLYMVTSDSRGSGKLVNFGEIYPDQIVEIGIAEQNLVGVASGLASMNKKVFAVSPACFLTARSLEQVKNDVCYSNNKVVLVGISAGVSYGALGSTHHSLHDFAALRAINNISIVAPADAFETEHAVKAAIESKQPVYLRFGKKNMPNLGQEISADFKIGKARIIKEGSDVQIVATGETVWPSLEAAKLLKEEGISAEVISMHTIKPLDTSVLNWEVPIVTVEEHSIYGGLGEAVGSFLLQNNHCVPFKIMGIPDEETVSGSQNEIFEHYQICPIGIANEVKKLLR